MESKAHYKQRCVVVLMVVAVVLLGSCSSVRYVEVPTVHTEYAYKTDTVCQRDSFYTHDSIYTLIKGDTVYMSKFKTIYRDRWHYQNHTDTLLKTDTLTQIQTVTVEKTRSISERVSDFMADILIFILISLIIYIAFKTYGYFKNSKG